MTQQEFDAACVELRTQKRQFMASLRNERAAAAHMLQVKRNEINARRDEVYRKYRDEVYDLASVHSTRSAEFVAGNARARNERAAALAELCQEWARIENEFFERSQELQQLGDQARHDFEMRRAEIIAEYSKWVEKRRAEKDADRAARLLLAQKGGEQ